MNKSQTSIYLKERRKHAGVATPELVPPLAPAFFRTRDVLRITSLSRATLYRRINAGRFPAPVHLGGRACGWPIAAVQDWIRDPDGYRTQPMDDPSC